MECQEVRDRFSSLLEGDLNPLEEKIVREHLDSCPECKKDFEKFRRMIQWLHSVEEAEVPDGFLEGTQKKVEERKRLGPTVGKTGPGWFGTLSQLKLPAQALAMVAIIFVVLYVTKRMPPEKMEVKVAEQEEVSQPERKMEERAVPREPEKKEESTSKPAEAFRPNQLEQEKTDLTPSIPKAEPPVAEVQRGKESVKPEGSPEETRREAKPLMAKEKFRFAGSPLQEIVLRVSDREKSLAELLELVKQSEGKVERKEENSLLASFPPANLSEFEKRLAELGSPKKLEAPVPYKDSATGTVSTPGAQRREDLERDKESRIFIRISLIQE